MTEEELNVIQKDYDLEKYNHSIIARTDMSGKEGWCRGCLFRTALPSCVLDHETRDRFSVCARNSVRLEEENNGTGKSKRGTGRSKSKDPNL